MRCVGCYSARSFVVWPLPLFGLDGSSIPAARFLQLAISLSALIATEGSGGLVGVFGLLLWAHAVVYGLFGVVLSGLVVRILAICFPRRLLVGCVAGAGVVLLAFGAFSALSMTRSFTIRTRTPR